ncbi:MAG: HAMP domain-containing sensor histidine kinase [Chloroflexota bacterium]
MGKLNQIIQAVRVVALVGWVLLTVQVLVATIINGQRLIYIETGSAAALIWLALMPVAWVLAWGLRVQQPAPLKEPAFYRTLAEKTGEAMLVYSVDDGLVWSNSAAHSLFPGDAPMPSNVERLAERALRSRNVITRIVPVEGAGRYSLQVFPVDDGHTAVIARATMAEGGRSKFYENFIRRIVHDMRNPLAAIIGHAANLRSAGPPDLNEVEKSAVTIEQEARRLARLVDSMLFDARLAYVPLAPERLDLVELIEDAMYTLEERTATTDKQITLDMPPTEALIEGDRDLLVRAFENLLDNSLKYTGDDGRVVVRLQAHDAGYDLAFIDNGNGIPPEFLPDRIFEPLVRATQGPGGSGLGLSIVKKIITMHSGTIHAESKMGRGTMMKIYLPRNTEDS